MLRASERNRMLPCLMRGALPEGGTTDLVPLDADHPGFRDQEYRQRRNEIARIALEHGTGEPVPDVTYAEDEQEVWRHIWTILGPLHEEKVCRELLDLQRGLNLSRERIPQLSEVNPILEAATGFRMEPVAGLVSSHAFLTELGRRVFLSTQYIRHSSRPLYTPEPDVVHELVGHAATLTHAGIARLNTVLGGAAEQADAERLLALERVYWYTAEYGAALQDGEVKAVGAGLLSSCGELAQFDTGPELWDWDLDRMAQTDYDPTDMQPQLFVAPSFERMVEDVVAWVEL